MQILKFCFHGTVSTITISFYCRPFQLHRAAPGLAGLKAAENSNYRILKRGSISIKVRAVISDLKRHIDVVLRRKVGTLLHCGGHTVLDSHQFGDADAARFRQRFVHVVFHVFVLRDDLAIQKASLCSFVEVDGNRDRDFHLTQCADQSGGGKCPRTAPKAGLNGVFLCGSKWSHRGAVQYRSRLILYNSIIGPMLQAFHLAASSS